MILASGGIVYHARAARSPINLFNPVGSWNPTRRQVSSWVRSWVESHEFRTLILIGPSAAYLMHDNLWSEIEQLVVIEPDRLAKWIFFQRFPVSRQAEKPITQSMKQSFKQSLNWIDRRDLLPYFSPKPKQFEEFLKNYDPQTTGVLFFGCLGQMPFHKKDFSRPEAEARELLLASIRHFETASLHDLASVTVPRLLADAQRELAELNLSLAETEYNSAALASLMGSFSNRLEDVKIHRPQAPYIWTDHDTYWLGPPKAICPWTLTSKQIHLLGFVERSR